MTIIRLDAHPRQDSTASNIRLGSRLQRPQPYFMFDLYSDHPHGLATELRFLMLLFGFIAAMHVDMVGFAETALSLIHI